MDIKAQLEMQRRYTAGDFAKDERDEIAVMSKKDVAELLEAHGLKPKGTLKEMRATLTRVMMLEA